MSEIRCAPYEGSLASLAAIAEPAWNEHYRARMRIDLWNAAFLEATLASGVALHPVAAYDGAEVVSVAIGLGFDGQLFGRPVRIIYWSWLTTVGARARTGVALKLVRWGLGYSRDCGYHVNAGLFDASSHATTMMRRHATGDAAMAGPFFVARHRPMARVLGRTVVGDLLLPAFDRFVLAATGAARTPCMPAAHAVRDIAREEIAAADALLSERAADLQVAYVAGGLAAPPFFRTVEVVRGDERIGLAQLLDLPMLGRAKVGCAAIERTWFAKSAFRRGMAALLAHLAAEGKGLALASLWPRGAGERWSLMTVGMLPDMTRPLVVGLWALDAERAHDVAKVRTATLPFR